jgi:hypothetical protein
MGEDPARIRADIEATREQMGETVQALSYKADVKARARDSIAGKKEALMGAKDSVRDKLVGAGDHVPDGEQVGRQARRAAGIAQENPLGLALGSVAVGVVVGLLLPASRVEDEKLGSVSDDVVEKVKETGAEAFERGKEVAHAAAESARETVQEKGREHGDELAASAQENLREATSSPRA